MNPFIHYIHQVNQLLYVNKTDANIYDPQELEYLKDIESGTVLSSFLPPDTDIVVPFSKQYIFGGKDDDTFSGASQNDHLYGGAGVDTISGNEGIA